jgi:hypothetical protein
MLLQPNPPHEHVHWPWPGRLKKSTTLGLAQWGEMRVHIWDIGRRGIGLVLDRLSLT